MPSPTIREPDAYRHCRLLDHGRGDWAMTIARRYLYDTADAVRLEALSGAPGRRWPIWSASSSAKSAITGCTPERGSSGWPVMVDEARTRLLLALRELQPDAATVFTPLPDEAALVESGILAAPMPELERRWRAAIGPTFAELGPADAAGADPAGAGPARSRAGVPLAVGRVHHGPAQRAGGDLVSPIAAQDGRDELTVRAALAEVADPEIPVVSILDLGMVEAVRVGSDGIHVVLLPTFVGCPALEVIRSAVEARLRDFDRPIDVHFEYHVPWTSDRITPDGREKLRAAGFAPPVRRRRPTRPCWSS